MTDELSPERTEAVLGVLQTCALALRGVTTTELRSISTTNGAPSWVAAWVAPVAALELIAPIAPPEAPDEAVCSSCATASASRPDGLCAVCGDAADVRGYLSTESTALGSRIHTALEAAI